MSSTKNNLYDLEDTYDRRFNDLNICYPVCRKFVPSRDNEAICECNRPEKGHPQIEKIKRGKSALPKLTDRMFDEKNRLINEKENAHGQLISGAWYARFDPRIDMESIQDILKKVWEFPQPKLLLSIIGGTKHFTLNQRLETNVSDEIINLATRSDVWIITSGYSNGLVQLVNQAVYKANFRKPDKKTVSLGICNWGGIKKPEKIIKPKRTGKTTANEKKAGTSDDSSSDSDDDDNTYGKQKSDRDLDMYHSHYLMLDDGSYANKDTGDFRTRLCKRLARAYDENNRNIPAITIVVEGGDSTIENIYNDIKADIPIAIIDGSGRVADFFSRWWIYTKDLRRNTELSNTIFEIDELKSSDDKISRIPNTTVHTRDERTQTGLKIHQVYVDLNNRKLSDIFTKYKSQLRQDLQKVLYSDDFPGEIPDILNDKLEDACQKVMFCLQPSVRSNIIIFNLNSDNDLSETLFRSITKTYKNASKKKKKSNKSDNKSDCDNLLNLAMDWNCINVAKEFVFENSLTNISNPHEFFKQALRRNLFTFVYEFINLGLDPVDVFFPNKVFMNGKNRYDSFINEFYSSEVIDMGKSQLKVIIAEDLKFKGGSICSPNDLNTLLRELIGDYMHKLYFNSLVEEDKARYRHGLILKSNEKGQLKFDDLENLVSRTDTEKRELAHDYIMRDLFLWSILMNYIDMAIVFLSFMKYRICPALIATKILNKYHKKAPYGEVKNEYAENATYFEQYAIDCLDKSDDHDVNKTCQIILQSNKLYGYVTCVQVAADARDQKFLAEPCCDEAMTNIWYDKLHPKQTRTRDFLNFIFALITFGLSAPFLKFRKPSPDTENPTKKLRSCGINYSDPYPLEYPRYSAKHLTLNRYAHQLINFHHSPMIKFCYHFIIYLFFLLLFSYVLLFKFSIPTNEIPSIDWTEILTIILVSCMTIEEIRYFISQDNITILGKLKNYFRDIFKWMIVIALILFYIGLIVRFRCTQSEEDFIAARVVMAIDVELWWLGFLSFVIVVPFLGPHLVAIQKMLRDLGFFILIILIVMIGYGVTTRSMYFYQPENNLTIADGGSIDTSFDGRSIFRQILYPVYYFLHGQYDNELQSLDQNPNSSASITSHVLFAGQMLFVNILLTNLLIAMFSKRFDQVHEDTRNIWLYQKYLYTREYYIRSPFFPPLSLFYDFYYIFRRLVFFLRTCCKKSADRKRRVFKMIPKEKDVTKDWYEFEGAATYSYAQNQVKAAKLKLTKLSTGQEINEDKTNAQKDANSTFESLRTVQEDMVKLNASIEGMRGDLRNRFSESQS